MKLNQQINKLKIEKYKLIGKFKKEKQRIFDELNLLSAEYSPKIDVITKQINSLENGPVKQKHATKVKQTVGRIHRQG